MERKHKSTVWLYGLIAVFALTAAGLFLMPDIQASSAAGKRPAEGPFVPASFTDLAKQAGPAVVNIRTVKTVENGGQVFRHFFGPGDPQNQSPFDEFFNRFFGQNDPREFKQRSLGSGFILDEEGFIATNNHVIENADQIQVKLKNGDEYDAEIIGTDPNTDLALIKITAEKKLPYLELGDSDATDIGQWVVAIGNPFGLEHTVTAGIVSAKGRVIGAGPYDDFIQTDASINPGNSGGPLVNLRGELMGVNTAIVGPNGGNVGIGFAIPVNMAKRIMDQLIEHGEVRRGQLGIMVQDLTPELAQAFGLQGKRGVVIAEVMPGSAAERAGLQPGDVVTAVDGEALEKASDLRNAIGMLPIGTPVMLNILRDGQPKQITAKIAAPSQARQAGGRLNAHLAGAYFTDIPSQARAQGVLVAKVEQGSPAYRYGLREDDIILTVNRQRVTDLQSFVQAVPGGQARLLLNLQRQGRALFLLMQ